jgi:two-component system, OmpR family, phosphate regulon response regulator PhoB
VNQARRVLIIDDTPEIAELLTFALRDRGYQALATGYTHAICDLIEDERADALVLDCSVYEMSESLFDMVRAHQGLADLPIVIISDMPEKADRSLQERDATRVVLIPKPFSGAQVARALDQLFAMVPSENEA